MRLPEKLPELSGGRLAAFKFAWWIVLALSLAALTAGQWGHARSASPVTLAAETLDALIVLTGGVLLFWRRRSDPVAALLSLGLLAVPSSDIAVLLPGPAWRETADAALEAVPMVCILLGMTVFPSGRFDPRWTLLIVPAIILWGLMLFAGGELPAVAQFLLVLPALVITVASLAFRYRRMDPGTGRQQVKWVMLGFAGFCACGLVEFALVLIEGAVSERAHFAIFLANNVLIVLEGACIVGGLLVSLLRYRLYDADAAISRSAVYAGLTVVLFGIFAASETLIQALSQKWLGAGTGAVGGAMAAALAASLLVPLHHRLNDWAKKRFQRDLSHLRAQLPEVLIAVRDSNDPKELAEDALQMAMRGVRAGYGAILLAEGSGYQVAHAENLPAAALADRLAVDSPADWSPADDAAWPLRLALIAPDGARVGWVALGPHPDGSLYGKDDRRAVEELAPPLARALALSMERARREQEREAERRTMTARLAQLEQALAQVISPPAAGGAS